MPWNWFNNAGVNALANAFEARGVTRQTTDQLPAEPRFLFEATDLVTGEAWLFERTMAPPRKVATAVAVSSCYPGFFRPFTESTPQHIALVDGGLHDNRAIEPVWRTHRHLLISDGGDMLQPQFGESILWSLIRSAKVLWNQSQVVQKRWVISNFLSGQMSGTYWDIESSPMHYLKDPGCTSFSGYHAGAGARCHRANTDRLRRVLSRGNGRPGESRLLHGRRRRARASGFVVSAR